MHPLASFTIRDKQGRKQFIHVVFNNENLLAINKPPGLRVIADHWIPSLPNLRDLLQKRLTKLNPDQNKKIFVVHRIDSQTSGLVVFALNSEMHKSMNNLFASNQIEKTYFAIVSGEPPEMSGIIDLPLRHHPSRKNFMEVHHQGKPSLTSYTLLKKFTHFSLLEVKPKTGRTHQIRVHLKNIGCPLAIDPLYGRAEAITISNIKRSPVFSKKTHSPIPLIARLTLHASIIRFIDPLSGEKHIFEAPPPKDFSALLKALQKWE